MNNVRFLSNFISPGIWDCFIFISKREVGWDINISSVLSYEFKHIFILYHVFIPLESGLILFFLPINVHFAVSECYNLYTLRSICTISSVCICCTWWWACFFVFTCLLTYATYRLLLFYLFFRLFFLNLVLRWKFVLLKVKNVERLLYI